MSARQVIVLVLFVLVFLLISYYTGTLLWRLADLWHIQ